jgi:hypothetical protein
MKRFIVPAAIAMAVLGGGGVAFASIPDSGGVIHGCYSAKDGTLRVIDTDAGQTCAKGENSLNWNQQGPQGPAGPAGPQGSPGPQGPAGVSGYQIETCLPGSGVQQSHLPGTYTITDPNGGPTYTYSYNPLCADTSQEPGNALATLSCPAGELAISAGYDLGFTFGAGGSPGPTVPQQMSPTPDGTGYRFFGSNDSGNMLIFVTCANAS